MRRFFAITVCFLILLSLYSPLTLNAEEGSRIDSILITNDGKTLKIECSVAKESSSTYYLLRHHVSDNSLSGQTPIAEAEANDGKVVFELPFDTDDHSNLFYGYVLASLSMGGAAPYTALTGSKYIDNVGDFAHSCVEPDKPLSKKGLEVQYITDAQLLGVSHTVVHAQLNELISASEDGSIAYMFGDEKYYINENAVTALDYRIKTLSAAGINVYLDLILNYDTSAPEIIYYPGAKGEDNRFFAPNLTSERAASIYAATLHFLAERYSTESGEYGYCSRYVIGYEVNNIERSHSTGISDLIGNVTEYAKYLRLADIALKSACSHAKVYASFSNRFNVTDPSVTGVFGAYSYLSALNGLISDIDYGIAVNPYPSTLTNTEYWNDDNASDSLDTEFITMKNISVLTSLLKNEEMLYRGEGRSVVITEFGTSGVLGEESEKLQAASFAYAYYTAENDPLIEAFIWHRHVDHISEVNLSYGLYSSSEFTLDAKDKKLLHTAFSHAGASGNESVEFIRSLVQYLPVDSYESLIGESGACSRDYINIDGITVGSLKGSEKIATLYDLSKNLYSFYPTDNAEYIELCTENDSAFMRIASLKHSSLEYKGAGIYVSSAFRTLDADYLTVRLRVTSSDSEADFSLILSGSAADSPILINCSSVVRTNEWLTVSFPVAQLKGKSIDSCILKLWVKTQSSRNEQIFLDVSEIALYRTVNNFPIFIVSALVAVAVLTVLTVAIYLIIYRIRKRRIR